MQAATTQRRKGGAPPTVATTTVEETPSNLPPPPLATVKRQKFGTGAFDEHWLNLDCCGLVCAAITYMLHMYGIYTVCFILLPPWMSVDSDNPDEPHKHVLTVWGHFHRTLFCLIAILACLSHFYAMTTDPGAVPPDATPLPDPDEEARGGECKEDDILVSPTQKGKRLCRRCKTFKPQRAHHCSVCRRCIIKMDHHCPWVNNCVGIGNHKYFLLFVFYTFLSCSYSMMLVVFRFALCMQTTKGQHHYHRSAYTPCLDQPTHLLNILGLVVESVLFGIFTSCMIFDQWDVVMSNVTHIDRLKGEQVGPSRVSGPAEVFGLSTRGNHSACRWDWLSPFAKVCFPTNIRNEILGYYRPCGISPEVELGTPTPTSRMVRSVAEIV